MACPALVFAVATLLPPIGLLEISVSHERETSHAKISDVIAIVRHVAMKQKSNAESDKLKTVESFIFEQSPFWLMVVAVIVMRNLGESPK